jgi:hypothetical protein
MQAFDIASQTLLMPSGLNNDQLQKIMGKLLIKNIDHADLYFQSRKRSKL